MTREMTDADMKQQIIDSNTDLNPDLLLNRELSSADFLMSVDELRRFLTIRGVI